MWTRQTGTLASPETRIRIFREQFITDILQPASQNIIFNGIYSVLKWNGFKTYSYLIAELLRVRTSRRLWMDTPRPTAAQPPPSGPSTGAAACPTTETSTAATTETTTRTQPTTAWASSCGGRAPSRALTRATCRPRPRRNFPELSTTPTPWGWKVRRGWAGKVLTQCCYCHWSWRSSWHYDDQWPVESHPGAQCPLSLL